MTVQPSRAVDAQELVPPDLLPDAGSEIGMRQPRLGLRKQYTVEDQAVGREGRGSRRRELTCRSIPTGLSSKEKSSYRDLRKYIWLQQVYLEPGHLYHNDKQETDLSEKGDEEG